MSTEETRKKLWEAIGHINGMGHDALQRRTDASVSTLSQDDPAFNIEQDAYASLQAKIAAAHYSLADKVMKAVLGE